MKNKKERSSQSPKQIVAILGLGTAVSLLGESTLYTVLPEPQIASQLGLTMTMVGVLLAANRATRLITNGPAGLLYGKFPHRPLLIASLFIGALSSVLYTVGFGFWPILFGRISWGIAWSLLWIGSRTVISKLASGQNRGYLNGLYQMYFLIGVGLASLFGGILTDVLGFRLMQRLSALVLVTAAVCWFFLLPETSRRNRASQSKNAEAKTEDSNLEFKKEENRKISWVRFLPAFIAILIARFIERGVLAATGVLWVSNLLKSDLSLFGVVLPVITLTGTYNALRILPGLAASPLIGWLSDRLGKRWAVMSIAFFINAAGMLLMKNPLQVFALLGALFTSVIGGSVDSLIPAVIGDQTDPAATGRVLGLTYIFADLGSTLGPLVSLAMLDASIVTLDNLYLAGAGLLLLTGGLSLIAARGERKLTTPC